MVAIFMLIVLAGIYILLWPQNFKQQISKRKIIEIRVLGICIIIFGLLSYFLLEAFRAKTKLLEIIDKSLSQCDNTEDTCSIKSNRLMTNDGDTSVYYDINLPENK